MPDPRKSQSLRVLAIDPFHGGSHRQFLRGVTNYSRHDWTLLVGKPVHWKWRMRSAPIELATTARTVIQTGDYPDLIFCSDMLDLPQWRGILRDARILRTAAAIYFHENQWTYPPAPHARIDSHFGYTNLVSALAADACWFNSAFHRDDFLKASETFLRRMPDTQGAHDFDCLAQKCEVIPPGFDPGPIASTDPPAASAGSTAITVGWVSRWEHDKRPDRFVDLLRRLDQRGVDVRLILLGPRPRQSPAALEELRDKFADRIVHDGFAEATSEYWSLLRRIDVVVSTADHEFFGIAICEAIWAGAAPVLPNRLSYPELVPRECLYDSPEQAVTMIQQLHDSRIRARHAAESRKRVAPLRIEQTVKQLDDALTRLANLTS